MGPQGRTSSGKSGLPGALRQPLLQNLPGLLRPGAARQASLGGLMMDPSQYGQIGSTLANTAFGGNLDVANTPQGQALTKAMQSQSGQYLGDQLADMRSRFAQSGQNLSGPLMQSSQQAIEKSTQNLNDTLAQQFFNQLGQERQLQMNALSGYSQYQQTPANLFGQMGSLMSSQQQTRPQGSPLGMVFGK